MGDVVVHRATAGTASRHGIGGIRQGTMPGLALCCSMVVAATTAGAASRHGIGHGFGHGLRRGASPGIALCGGMGVASTAALADGTGPAGRTATGGSGKGCTAAAPTASRGVAFTRSGPAVAAADASRSAAAPWECRAREESPSTRTAAGWNPGAEGAAVEHGRARSILRRGLFQHHTRAAPCRPAEDGTSCRRRSHRVAASLCIFAVGPAPCELRLASR